MTRLIWPEFQRIVQTKKNGERSFCRSPRSFRRKRSTQIYGHLLPWPKKSATTIMHKIKTLFLSRNISMIRRLAQWHDWQWHGRDFAHRCPPIERSAIKLDFSISHDRNSVLILCIIVVAVFFFVQVVFKDVTSAEVAHCFRGGLSGLSFGGHFPLKLNHSLWLFSSSESLSWSPFS